MSDASRDPGLQRISDAERQQVAEALQRAAGEGRLDLDELEERLEATWAARTYVDLAPVLADLPDRAPTPPGGLGSTASAPSTAPAVPRRDGMPVLSDDEEKTQSVGVLSEKKRAGVWRIAPEHTATSVLGAVTIDLREAVFTAQETVLTANAVLGAVEVYVDAETAVVVDGTPILGAFEPVHEKVPAQLHEDSPVLRVRGMSLLGSVTVVRKRLPGEKKRGWKS